MVRGPKQDGPERTRTHVENVRIPYCSDRWRALIGRPVGKLWNLFFIFAIYEYTDIPVLNLSNLCFNKIKSAHNFF